MTYSQRRVVHIAAATLLLLTSLLTASVSVASAPASTSHSASATASHLWPRSAHLFNTTPGGLTSSTQAYDIEGYNYYCTNGGTACAANANGSVRNCLSTGITCSGLNYADAEAYGPPDGSTAGTPDAMVVECAQFTSTGYKEATVSVYSSTGQSTYQGVEKDLGTISGKGTVFTASPSSLTGAEDNYAQTSSISGTAYDAHSGVNGGSDTASVTGTQNTDNNADAYNGGEFSITINGEIDTYNTNGVFQSSSTGTISCTAGGTHANDLYDAGLDSPYFEGELEWVNNAAGVNAWNDVPLGGGAGFSLEMNALDAGLVTTVPLFEIAGVNGFDASLALVYSSYSSSGAGASGYGWSLAPADMHLSISSQAVTLVDPTGATYTFNEPTSCSFTSPPGIDAVLACSNGEYTLTYNASDEVDTFDSAGYLTQMANRAGNTISFTRDSNHLVTSITTTEGQTIGLTYTNGLLTTITEPGSETWTLGQDQNGNLTTLTDPTGAVMKFASTVVGGSPGNQKPTFHDLTKITDADGNATSIGYDAGQGGEITSLTNAASKTWSIEPGSITDPNNHTTTFGFDSQNRITSVTYPDSTSATQTWTSDNQIASVTAPSNATTTLTYDSKNNLTQVALPTGVKESWAYGNRSLPYLSTSYTDAQGNTTSYSYTSQGLLSTVTDPNNKTQTYSYNSNGTLATATDENGHQTGYTYNNLGLLQQETPPSPLGSTSMTYNADDQENSVTDGNGKLTAFTYSKRGEVTGVGFADGTSIGYAFDPAGNLLGMTDSTGNTSYHYDNLNQMISEVLPNKATGCTDSAGNPATTCYAYDAVGNLLSKTDSAGTTSYGYNSLDQMTGVTDRAGKSYTLGYNQDGEQTSIAFPNGVTESMGYDTAGNLTSIKSVNSSSQTLTSYSYSYTNPSTNQPAALPYSMTDTAGNTTSYSYDNGNNLTQALQKTSGGSTLNTWSYGYDPVGNLTSSTANGTQTTFSYNAADELTSASGGMNRTFTYDGNGDRTSSSDGTQITLNAAGQITSITPPNNSPIPYTYTGVGETQRIGNGSTSYQWDGSGISQQTDSSGTTTFTTTPDGQCLSETIPSGPNAGTYYYLSDGAGDVAALTDANGNVVDSYSYDPLGNAASSGSVPNPFTFQGWQFDSQTGYYYTGSGYYDPATAQSFGCRDNGSVDPGEDRCGEDEAPYDDSYYRTKAVALCDTSKFFWPCVPFGSAYVTVHYHGHGRISVTLTIEAPKKHIVTGGAFGITVGSQPCTRSVLGVGFSRTYSTSPCAFTLPVRQSARKTQHVEVAADATATFCSLGGFGSPSGGDDVPGGPLPDLEGCAGSNEIPFLVPV